MHHSCRSGAHGIKLIIELMLHNCQDNLMTLPNNTVAPRCRLQVLLSRKLCVTMAVRRLRQLEGKVATLSVINDALQKENDTLREVRLV